jgi:hypothetical protein
LVTEIENVTPGVGPSNLEHSGETRSDDLKPSTPVIVSNLAAAAFFAALAAYYAWELIAGRV